MVASETYTSSTILHESTGVTYHFSEPVEYGYYWNGDIFVVSNDKDIILIGIDPESTSSGRIMNGVMLQPHESNGSGFDSVAGKGPSFDASHNVDPAASGVDLRVAFNEFPNGASIVKAVSTVDLATQNDRSSIDKFSVLTITPEIPPKDSFRPPVAGDDKTSSYSLADLDFSKLQSIEPVADQRDISTYDYLHSSTFVSWIGGSEGLRFLHPNSYHNGYGDYQMDALVDGFLALHSDYSNEEKLDLLAAFVQIGIDYAGGADVGVSRIADGGHNNEYKPFVVLAASALNSEEIAELAQKDGAFSEDKQFRYITEDDVGKESFNFVLNKTPLAGSTYQEEQVGMAEWVIDSNRSDPSLGASYRWHNSDNVPALALAIEMLGNGEGREIWDHEAYFDYAARVQNIFEVDTRPVWNSSVHSATSAWMSFVENYYDEHSAGSSSIFLPEAPYNLVVESIDSDVWVSIEGDVFPGGSPVERVDLRYSTDREAWLTIEDFGLSGNLNELAGEGVYFVQARFVNENGAGPWSSNQFIVRNNFIIPTLEAEGLITIDDNLGLKGFAKSHQYKNELYKILEGEEGYEELTETMISGAIFVEGKSTEPTSEPFIAIPLLDQSLPEDTAVDFSIHPDSFIGFEGSDLSISASLVAGGSIPSWLNFNGVAFSGSPPADFTGALEIVVTASDGELSIEDAFTLSITPVNDAPTATLALEDQSSPEDATVRFQIPPGAFADVDGDDLTLTASLTNGGPLPEWLSFDGHSFFGQPPLNFNGDVAVVVTASDGQLSVDSTFTLAITPMNDAPTATLALEDQSSPEDATVRFQIPPGVFADVDGDDLTLTASLTNGEPLPEWLSFEESTFNGQPPQDFNGVLDIAVTASDGTLTVSNIFSLTIMPVDDVPIAQDDGPLDAIAGQTMTIATQDLLANDLDIDGKGISIIEVGDAVGGKVELGANNDIKFTPHEGMHGKATFNYTLTNGSHQSMATVTLEVQKGVTIDPYRDYVKGTEGVDLLFINLFSENKIFGDAGNDYVYGGFLQDTLVGGDGHDKLWGLFGNDRLEGGEGNDRLRGGHGEDVFVFAEGDGKDFIADFNFSGWFNAGLSNNDKIELDIDGIETGEEALSFAKQVGKSVVFDFGNGDSLILRTTNLNHLGEDDFIFA